MVNRERLVNTLCDLVRIDSPSGEEAAVAAELHRRLTPLGFIVAQDAYGNVIASEAGGSSGHPLILSAHMDTVEPGRGIKPVVNGDRVGTDGSTVLGGDPKAGIAAILEGLTLAKEQGLQRRPLQLVFTRQEEGGLVGAKNLDYSMVRAREAVVFDGDGAVTNVTTASPTHMRFVVTVTGRAAHAGVEPEKGISAVRIAAELVLALPQGRLDAETTFNIGTIKGGTVRNAVPESAEFVGEFRSRNLETLELTRRRFMEAVEATRRKHGNAKIVDDLELSYGGYNLGHEEPVLALTARAMAKLGLTPKLGPTGGGTDGNIFSQHGIRPVVVGMASMDMHTTREWVSVPHLMDTARFCLALITDVG